ncbi:hypothetical protein [Streptomyces sp. NPDC006640]|uniref:hypothetical protein n=1 Tax=unclassified Streptomyces TaxID=2593676 RepID=UPI0036BBECC6
MSVTPIRPPRPNDPTEGDVRRKAMELVLHRLTVDEPAAVYDELVRLTQPAGVGPLMEIAVHLADAMVATLTEQSGGREAAITSLQAQIGEVSR